MYFSKNFYLREAINYKLNELQTAGILEFWIKNYADMRFYKMKGEQIGPKKMEIEQLFGAFNLLFIGLGVGIIVFIVELTGLSLKKVFRNSHSSIAIRDK